MSKKTKDAFKDMRHIAWEYEFNLLDNENRNRMSQRRRAHHTALHRGHVRADPVTLPDIEASKHFNRAAATFNSLQPILGTTNLPLTQHAVHRLRNRGITMDQVIAVSLFGKERRTYGGATKYFLDKRSRQLLSEDLPHDAIRKLGKLDIVAVAGVGAVIAIAHRARRTRND